MYKAFDIKNISSHFLRRSFPFFAQRLAPFFPRKTFMIQDCKFIMFTWRRQKVLWKMSFLGFRFCVIGMVVYMAFCRLLHVEAILQLIGIYKIYLRDILPSLPSGGNSWMRFSPNFLLIRLSWFNILSLQPPYFTSYFSWVVTKLNDFSFFSIPCCLQVFSRIQLGGM